MRSFSPIRSKCWNYSNYQVNSKGRKKRKKEIVNLISSSRDISSGANIAAADLHTTAGTGAITGSPWLMLLTLTFNLWMVWLFSSYIFNLTTMTAKVRSDENMMKQQFIFPPFSPLPFPLSLSIWLPIFMSLSPGTEGHRGVFNYKKNRGVNWT